MNTREDSWAAAMKAERHGDVAAYERVLADIARALRGIIRSRLYRLGLNPQETEDIVQEILIGLHTMRHRWDAGRPFLPWLHAIVRYKLTDAVRKRRREARHRIDLAIEDWDRIADDAADASHQIPIDLDRQLDTLSAGQRDVVQSLAIDGASVRETAQRLQTSEGAVRVTLHRALQRLSSLANTTASVQKRGRL